MAQEIAEACSFVTDRLVVGRNRHFDTMRDVDLVDAVTTVLTPATTAWLPDPWRGSYDRDRAEAWLDERDAESPTLLVLDRESNAAVGLLILYEDPLADSAPNTEIRFGYVLAEAAWGKGLATELVGGLVDWATSRPEIISLSGGVAIGNAASARVLEKRGFTAGEVHHDERNYRLDLR